MTTNLQQQKNLTHSTPFSHNSLTFYNPSSTAPLFPSNYGQSDSNPPATSISLLPTPYPPNLAHYVPQFQALATSHHTSLLGYNPSKRLTNAPASSYKSTTSDPGAPFLHYIDSRMTQASCCTFTFGCCARRWSAAR